MTLNIRVGTSSDQDVIVDFIVLAGDGIYEQMIEDAYPGLRTVDALKLGVNDENSAYHCENALLVESEGEVVGGLISFPADQYGPPEVMRTVIPAARLAPLEPLFASSVPGSLYVNTLAVKEAERGRGIARLLIDLAEEMAIEGGFHSITLHSWADNAPALALYHGRDYEVAERIPVPRTEYLHHDAPMLLLKKNLPTIVEAAI